MSLTSDEAATLMISVGATGICVIALGLVVILWLVVGRIYGLDRRED